jgi:RimJ/RimL family protein N-acetyltransferase
MAMSVCAPWEQDATLRGGRVTLRPLTAEDAAELLSALDESRERFFPWLGFADRLHMLEDCHDHILRAQADWLRGDHYSFGVRDPTTDRLLGGVDLFRHHRDHAAGVFAIGYWLRTGAEGHGSMSDAVRLVTRFAFERIEVSRVEIICDARNTRSATVARRLGFVAEGRLRGDTRAYDGILRDTLIFARLPSDPPGALEDEH